MRNDDRKYYETMANNSPKRLNIAGASHDQFDSNFNAERLIAEHSDRYIHGKTTRGRDFSSARHPPKLSPRATNKSVDPNVRRANLLSKLPAKTSVGGFTPLKDTLNKKPSLDLQTAEDQRMTSKYANFNPEHQKSSIDVDLNQAAEPIIVGGKKKKGSKLRGGKSGARSPSPS